MESISDKGDTEASINWPVERLQSLLNIDHPIVQAPMGGATSPQLTAAVSNEGGFGMVAGISSTPSRLQQMITETKALTEKGFGVNVVFKDDVDPLVDVACKEGVDAVSFFWGDPSKYVDRVHDSGALVIHTVSSVDEAKRSIDGGTDILVAQGWEAGGHVPGSVSTMVLIPAVVDAVGEIPVLAAGGITCGRSIVAALALGASGVWMGTRFLGAREASIHSDYRERLFQAKETDTFYSQLFNKGWECSHRTLRNSTFERWDKAGRPEPGARPGESDVVALKPDGTPIERYTSATPHETFTGEIEALPMWAGQGVHAIKCVQSASDIFRELVKETQECLDRL
jgi:nitronate monooxygenase